MSSTGERPVVGAIGCTLLPPCGEPLRRERLRESGHLNGIDYVEVGDDGTSLCVHLLGEIPEALGVANVRISGGDRIVGLRVLAAGAEHDPDLHDDACLRVQLDRQGDHTAYCLCLVEAGAGDDPASWRAFAGFDPRYACASVRFRLDCAKDFDCLDADACMPVPQPPPEIDYLARDYASFRRLFLDRIALDMPAWQERHVPDLGIALVETLAYAADQLSYYQDAVATEAYLDTARRRISVRRHARLVDYRMHEGCNARALVALALAAGEVTLELADLLLLVPPAGQGELRPGTIDARQLATAREQGALVFEPMPLDGATTFTVLAAHNEIHLHTWADEACCLPRGSTRATLVDAALQPGAPVTDAPLARSAESQRALKLKAGDLLIFEEVLGPPTGNPADADPTHRHAVRLTEVQPTIDPLDGSLLLEVAWDACDALPFDLCLSVRRPAPDCRWLHDVSLARGNVLLVDHGEHVRGQCQCEPICASGANDNEFPGLAIGLAALPDACARCGTLGEDCWLVPGTIRYGCCRCEGAVQDVIRQPGATGHVVPGTPLTWAEPLPAQPLAPLCQLLARDPRAALPQLRVYGGPLGDVLVDGLPDPSWRWEPRADLLASTPDERHVVVEIDDEGVTHLRFGDGVLGRQPQAGEFFRAAPRIGNGPAGNVGRDSIVWLASRSGAPLADLQPRNPLPANGGTAPESMAETKLYAPGAFRANPLRAIVADDYAMFAARAPELQGAAATLDWNGSGYEVDVVIDPRGREALPDGLAATIDAGLQRYRRIGHEVAVHAACPVPLSIAMLVCVLPDFLVAHVALELHDRFGAGLRRDGMPGFFHPDRLQLGAPVYASALIAEAQAITGVAHVELRTLARMDDPHAGVPADGILRLASCQIVQVDSDPDHPDHGRIVFTLGGGR